MKRLYVAGPVIRRKVLDPLTALGADIWGNAAITGSDESASIYALIREAATMFGMQLQLPEWDLTLDGREPQLFVEEIFSRIKAAHAVIAVLADGNTSPVVEAVYASQQRKPQMIICHDKRVLSRMVRGLPMVFDTADAADQMLKQRVTNFLLHVSGGGPGTTGSDDWSFRRF